MLVLTRKIQQQIKIGEQVTITILRVKGQTVRVGIEAPRDVRVISGELPSGSDMPGGSAGAELATEETTLVINGVDIGPDNDGSDAHDEASVLDEATAPRREPAVPRLPQRKRFNRAGSPPLRVAMATVSPSLAK